MRNIKVFNYKRFNHMSNTFLFPRLDIIDEINVETHGRRYLFSNLYVSEMSVKTT